MSDRLGNWHNRAASCIAILLVGSISLFLTREVPGCGWGVTDHSVRFNGFRSPRDFGRLPRLALSESEKKIDQDSERLGRDWYADPYGILESLWTRAEETQRNGDLERLKQLLNEYLERSASLALRREPSRGDIQQRRNSSRDKLDALRGLDLGTPSRTLCAYVDARSAYDAGEPADQVLAIVRDAERQKSLSDNVAYLKAALLYRDGSEGSADAFRALAVRFPGSEKIEAALYMAAVVEMKKSRSYARALKSEGKTAAPEDPRDAAYRRAMDLFKSLLRKYPKGRYAGDARGWLAFLCLGVGDRAGALVEYYRLLADADPEPRDEGLISLSLVRREADDHDLRLIEQVLEREPSVAMVYAYYEIYNKALPALSRLPGLQTARKTNREDLERVAGFATRLLNRYPRADPAAGLILRTAQANLELERDRDAATLAARVLRMGVTGEARAEALWVEGVARHRLGEHGQARKLMSALVEENPKNRFTEGARRNLAMLAEDMGHLGAALEQYIALGYESDVLYFADVLMTPEELAEFIDRHPKIQVRDQLLYALGIRYLRDRRWNDARAVLEKCRTVGTAADEAEGYREPAYFDGYNSYYGSRYDIDLTNFHVFGSSQVEKAQDWSPKVSGIRSGWILQDLSTAETLERLEAEVERARDDESKAEALYQLASYQYESTLAFYNPLWGGRRHGSLYILDYYGNYRQPDEALRVFNIWKGMIERLTPCSFILR